MNTYHKFVPNVFLAKCDESIQFALKENTCHHIDHIYVGVRGCQMIVARNKRFLRRKGLKYIEKKRMFYELLSDERLKNTGLRLSKPSPR